MQTHTKHALTRAVSPHISNCELTHLDRSPIDDVRAALQHEAYEDLLRDLGYHVEQISPEPEHADGVFVEDTAIVLDDIAVMTRPGAESRRGEVLSVAMALRKYRPLRFIDAGTLDGGDVLRIGRTLYVGLSARTNENGIEELAKIVMPLGYDVVPVEFQGALHLKSAVSLIAQQTLLANPDYVDPQTFDTMKIVEVDAAEPNAANALLLDEGVIFPTSYPLTMQRVRRCDISLHPIDISELIKAEAGVTCCSLLV